MQVECVHWAGGLDAPDRFGYLRIANQAANGELVFARETVRGVLAVADPAIPAPANDVRFEAADYEPLIMQGLARGEIERAPQAVGIK